MADWTLVWRVSPSQMVARLTLPHAAVAGAAFLIGLSKGGLGGMLGAIITPMLTLVLPADVVIGLMLPLLMVGDIFAIRAHWRNWERGAVVTLIPAAFVGVIIGTVFITNVPTETLRRGLGIIGGLFAAYKVLEPRILRGGHISFRPWHAILAGGVSGFTSTLAHLGGPPITIYLLMRDLRPPVFVATSALFFAVLNAVKVPFYIYANLLDIPLLLNYLWTAPMLPLGVWAGKNLVYRINKRTFEQLIVALLAIASATLIFS